MKELIERYRKYWNKGYTFTTGTTWGMNKVESFEELKDELLDIREEWYRDEMTINEEIDDEAKTIKLYYDFE